ncbi:MAG: CsgG/HfaB family protein [Kiritimatiellia bacterium]
MKAEIQPFVLAVLMAGVTCGSAFPAVAAEARNVYPVAVLAFEERGAGAKNYGQKASDILFAVLSADTNLVMVDRQDLKNILAEHELNLSGAVTPDKAVQISRLSGAKILVTGSIIESDKTLYLVAKIIGTETSRVLGESIKGKTSDEFSPLVEELGKKVAGAIAGQADKLVAEEVRLEDRIAALNKRLGDARRGVVAIKVNERHIGQPTFDPAAETELALFCKETGFQVLDKAADPKKADIMLEGEGFSEFAMRHGNLVSVKARLEIKAIDRQSDRIIAVDRQTTVVVDLTEQIAGKSALQRAAADIAERLLPKLAGK